MNTRRISVGLILAVAGLGTLSYLVNHANAEADDPTAPVQAAVATRWEYAELEYRGTLSKKKSHHAWQWISSEEGLEVFQGRSEIATMRDLCHEIADTPVDFRSNEARNTHIMLLDTIGREGWEMVHHSQEIRDRPLNANAGASGKPDLATFVNWRWSFKRAR